MANIAQYGAGEVTGIVTIGSTGLTGETVEWDIASTKQQGLTLNFASIGSLTVTAQASWDGTNWVTFSGWDNVLTGRSTSTKNANGQWYFDLTGVPRFRINLTTYVSGTVILSWGLSPTPSPSHALGVAVDTVNTMFPGTAATNLGKAEDAASVNADVGVFVFSIRRSTITASPTSTTGDYQEIVTGDDGQLGVRVVPSTLATGFSSTFLVSAASNNATNIKASAGALSRIIVANSNAAIRYLKFYNKATAPTVGTDTPVLVVGCQPSATTHLDLGINPFTFPLGIGFGMVTGAANSDNTAVAASDLIATMYWV